MGSIQRCTISEIAGKVEFEDFEQGITYRIEIDEQTGFKEKVIIETKDKKKIPILRVGQEKIKIITYQLALTLMLMKPKNQVR